MKRPVALLVALVLVVGLAWPALCQTGYLRILLCGKIYNGLTQYQNGKLLLPITDFAAAMKLQVRQDGLVWSLSSAGSEPAAVAASANNEPTLFVNGQAVPGALLKDNDGVWVDVEATAIAAGAFCRGVGADTLELGYERKFTPDIAIVPGVSQALFRTGSVTSPAQLDELYGIARTTVEGIIGKIPMPISRRWLSKADWTREYGGSEAGHADCSFNATHVFALQISIPYEMGGGLTLCSMSHEIAHCWQYSHGILKCDRKYMEGFPQWVALKVCTAYQCPGVVYAYEGDDRLGPYYQGLVYYQKVERQHGIKGVLQDMLQYSRSGGN